MNFAGAVRRQAVLLAKSQVVVVRADHDHLIAHCRVAAGQQSNHVAQRCLLLGDLGLDPQLHPVGEQEALIAQVAVNRPLDALQGAPRALHPLFRHRLPHLDHRNAQVARPVNAAEPDQPVARMRRRVVDQHHGCRAVVPRVDRFVDQPGVARDPPTPEHALLVFFLWLVPQHQHHLAGHVDPGVVVVVVLGSRDSVSDEGHAAGFLLAR